MEREGVSTLYIRSYLRALRYLLIFQIACVCFAFEIFLFYFVLTLVSVLKSVTKLFLKTLFEKSVSVEKFVMSKYLLASTYSEKNIVSILVSFRQCYPTIEK